MYVLHVCSLMNIFNRFGTSALYSYKNRDIDLLLSKKPFFLCPSPSSLSLHTLSSYASWPLRGPAPPPPQTPQQTSRHLPPTLPSTQPPTQPRTWGLTTAWTAWTGWGSVRPVSLARMKVTFTWMTFRLTTFVQRQGRLRCQMLQTTAHDPQEVSLVCQIV